MKNKGIIHELLFYGFAIIVAMILVFPKNAKKEEIKIVGIDIKGEVVAPGYYELEYGSRIKDAIMSAGGETEKADISSVNLATKLVDGEEIIIPSAESDARKSSLININTADMYKLCKLDGIGESIAGKIIDYRAQNGKFKKIDDLKKVDGIGKQKFDKIKDKITVE